MATASLPENSRPKRKRKKKRRLPLGVVEKEGKWYVRIRFREGGRRHASWRECAKNPKHAKEIRDELLAELKQHGPQVLLHSRQSFGALADYYEETYLVEARYVDGRKFAGRRNTKNPKLRLKQLRAAIGDATPLRNIDFEYLRALRIRLLEQPVVIERWTPEGKKRKGKKVRTERQRSVVDVNRKMEQLRHMLHVALRKRWLTRDPFADAAEPLITPGDEKKRRRVMSFEEESALLAHCGEPREHLRLVIIGLVDTLMRATEFFKLRVADLALDSRKITVLQMNTKTLVERPAPMSRRFADELEKWIRNNDLAPEDHLFAFHNVKRAWGTAKRKAGIVDLRLKDLRRTGATRLLRAGMPIEEISRILGHTTITMTYEYIGVDRDTTTRANEFLDAMHEAALQATETVN